MKEPMDADRAKQIMDDMCSSFVQKGRLLLTVDVRTKEEAEEIMRWMYAPEKPMKAQLHEVAWDKVPVSAAVADAIEVIRQALAGSAPGGD